MPGKRLPLALLMPNPRIDTGVQQIGDRIGKDDPKDHDDRPCFIHHESWRFREAAVSGISELASSPDTENVARQDQTPSVLWVFFNHSVDDLHILAAKPEAVGTKTLQRKASGSARSSRITDACPSGFRGWRDRATCTGSAD